MAAKLRAAQWLVSWTLSDLGVLLQARPQRFAQQRRRVAEERVGARVGELGFADAQAYLLTRVAERGWLLWAVVAELGFDPVTVRRLLDRYGGRRSRHTAWGHAALAPPRAPCRPARE